jgi:CRISPR-associated protein Cas2
LTVIVAERVTPGTRGLLTRWMLEVHPGVFVGTLSSRVRDALWTELLSRRRRVGTSALLMAHRTPGEQGFQLVSSGQGSRTIFDYDGLTLVGKLVNDATPPRRRRAKSPSNAL